MPYYQGDFYQGDYYSGDPFFGALLGRVARFAVGAGRRLVQRHPTITAAAAPAAAGVASTGIVRQIPGAIMRVPGVGPMISRVGGVVAKHPVLSAAAAAGTIGVLGGTGAARVGVHPGAAAGVLPRGFHLSRRTGQVVRNRRMRVTNPRALRRAIRRATGFARLARRVLHFTSPRAPRGRAIFKRRFKRK